MILSSPTAREPSPGRSRLRGDQERPSRAIRDAPGACISAPWHSLGHAASRRRSATVSPARRRPSDPHCTSTHLNLRCNLDVEARRSASTGDPNWPNIRPRVLRWWAGRAGRTWGGHKVPNRSVLMPKTNLLPKEDQPCTWPHVLRHLRLVLRPHTCLNRSQTPSKVQEVRQPCSSTCSAWTPRFN